MKSRLLKLVHIFSFEMSPGLLMMSGNFCKPCLWLSRIPDNRGGRISDNSGGSLMSDSTLSHTCYTHIRCYSSVNSCTISVFGIIYLTLGLYWNFLHFSWSIVLEIIMCTNITRLSQFKEKKHVEVAQLYYAKHCLAKQKKKIYIFV